MSIRGSIPRFYIRHNIDCSSYSSGVGTNKKVEVNLRVEFSIKLTSGTVDGRDHRAAGPQVPRRVDRS